MRDFRVARRVVATGIRLDGPMGRRGYGQTGGRGKILVCGEGWAFSRGYDFSTPRMCGGVGCVGIVADDDLGGGY